MTIKELFESLCAGIESVDVKKYAPLSRKEKWEKSVGVMDDSMKYAYSRMIQLYEEAAELEKKKKTKNDELRLSLIANEIDPCEIILSTLVLNSFPEAVAHEKIEMRLGWKIVVIPTVYNALTPEDRSGVFSIISSKTH